MLAIKAHAERNSVLTLTMTCDVACEPSPIGQADRPSLREENLAVASEAGFEKKGKPPTLADVAREAKVSTVTVSRVVNGHSSVNPTLRTRVEDAMKRLSYTPNEAARSMRAMMRNGYDGDAERDLNYVINNTDAKPPV